MTSIIFPPTQPIPVDNLEELILKEIFVHTSLKGEKRGITLDEIAEDLKSSEFTEIERILDALVKPSSAIIKMDQRNNSSDMEYYYELSPNFQNFILKMLIETEKGVQSPYLNDAQKQKEYDEFAFTFDQLMQIYNEANGTAVKSHAISEYLLRFREIKLIKARRTESNVFLYSFNVKFIQSVRELQNDYETSRFIQNFTHDGHYLNPSMHDFFFKSPREMSINYVKIEELANDPSSGWKLNDNSVSRDYPTPLCTINILIYSNLDKEGKQSKMHKIIINAKQERYSYDRRENKMVHEKHSSISLSEFEFLVNYIINIFHQLALEKIILFPPERFWDFILYKIGFNVDRNLAKITDKVHEQIEGFTFEREITLTHYRFVVRQYLFQNKNQEPQVRLESHEMVNSLNDVKGMNYFLTEILSGIVKTNTSFELEAKIHQVDIALVEVKTTLKREFENNENKIKKQDQNINAKLNFIRKELELSHSKLADNDFKINKNIDRRLEDVSNKLEGATTSLEEVTNDHASQTTILTQIKEQLSEESSEIKIIKKDIDKQAIVLQTHEETIQAIADADIQFRNAIEETNHQTHEVIQNSKKQTQDDIKHLGETLSDPIKELAKSVKVIVDRTLQNEKDNEPKMKHKLADNLSETFFNPNPFDRITKKKDKGK